MLDLTIGLEELKYVSEIHIVAVNNEVKEILWLVDLGFNSNPKIKTINFNRETQDVYEFTWNSQSTTEYSLPQTYLYEPNAAIMKSGAFDLLSKNFKVNKLHKHTHLYTSKELIKFPGRRFLVKETIPFHKKNYKKLKSITKANVTTRNFPKSVSDVRKLLKINDGGNDYLFFATNHEDEKVILICSKA